MRGIDVAKWQGTIDWKKVKDSGCEFAILKVIDIRGNKESAFDRNYSGCIENGIPVGVYNYSYATDITRAKSDANKVVSIISGKSIPFKVWLDVEDKCQQGIGQRLIDIIKAYQKVIESAGYQFGVYTGLSFYNSYIRPYASQINCPFWIARYPSTARIKLDALLQDNKKPVILHELWGWQYTSVGSVSGITGNVDLNVCYSNVAVTKPTQTIPQAKPKNPYVEPTKTLKKGMKSGSVKWLQWELVQSGFNISIDGDFGPATDRAVRSFQKLYNLKIDGIVGSATRSMLKALKPTPVPTVKKANPYIEPSVLLKKGMKSDSVKWLQWELVQSGFSISIDGIFGPATDKAVRSFQKLYNLKVDGIVGDATRSMLKTK